MKYDKRIEHALSSLKIRPGSLQWYLNNAGPDFEPVSQSEIDEMIGIILSDNANDKFRLQFSNILRTWDNVEANDSWTENTKRNTDARRKLIYKKLNIDVQKQNKIDTLIPHFLIEEPVVIAEKLEKWYHPEEGVDDYHWNAYKNYLRDKKNWGEESITNLDNATSVIIGNLSNPKAEKAYSSRGLVMGYVQSGKTANFMGVAAKAADAGYRLIIVLAGTWNILREQTQRRFDKELLGQKFLMNDDSYTEKLPPDWDDFLTHCDDPYNVDISPWQRLTRIGSDFKPLKAAIDSIKFTRHDSSKPFNDPVNLRKMPIKLLIVKKHPRILNDLAKDLSTPKADDVPVLIIDDESDQAGLNTSTTTKKTESDRSPTNKAITKLLSLFPRGQYIGYTATPYANVLINPDDAEDLFPKDFIVSLDRPAGYMGVSDFFDPTLSHDDLDENDYSQPEIAYIRRVEIDHENEKLRHALQSYVLSGAIKLYRAEKDPARYRPNYFQHHTMLIHTSQLKGMHSSLATDVATLWDECAFNSPDGLASLEKLWNTDFKPVSESIGKMEILPGHFNELIPFLSASIRRIEKGDRVHYLMNGDNSDAPDFGEESIWKIFIGGNKLSRGYTIEGLTISYYRRTAGTGDTLMQMGRWFGFRPGYRDLVRVYLGVNEGKKGNTDLVSQFKEICLMEENFRTEIKRYTRDPGAEPITPKQVPPLISLFGDLPPTAKNKMFNAVLEMRNYGGQRSMPTKVASDKARSKKNEELVKSLFESKFENNPTLLEGYLNTEKPVKMNTYIGKLKGSADVINFLKEFSWIESTYAESERPKDISLQIEFLKKENHQIKKWLVLAPQRNESFGSTLSLGKEKHLTVKKRSLKGDGSYGVFGEPDHRHIANYLAGIKDDNVNIEKPSETLQKLKENNCGVLVIYPVRATENQRAVSIGYEIFFPPNDLKLQIGFSVKPKKDAATVMP